MDLETYENTHPHVKLDGITFHTPNKHCLWRVETLYTKEPDTIEWIKSMRPGQVLYDVGANMGQYALFAAYRGITVHAFEPEAQNFALLTRNIATNKLDNITAWPLALSNKPEIAVMHLTNMGAGGSCHSFGQSINYNGEPKHFPYTQGSIATTLDILSSQLSPPDHIKIDVDGFEHLVIEGGITALRQAKSVLIEINTHYAEHMDVLVPRMLNHGFTYSEAQAESSRRKEGPFKGIGNIIFYKG